MAKESTIFIVEDDPEMREILPAHFLEHGYASKIITSVEAACQLAEQRFQRLKLTIPKVDPAASRQAAKELPKSERQTHHVATVPPADASLATPQQLHRSLQSTL